MDRNGPMLIVYLEMNFDPTTRRIDNCHSQTRPVSSLHGPGSWSRSAYIGVHGATAGPQGLRPGGGATGRTVPYGAVRSYTHKATTHGSSEGPRTPPCPPPSCASGKGYPF